MYLVMDGEEIVEHSLISMEGESKVTYAPFLPFSHEIFQKPYIQEVPVQFLQSAAADCVDQIVVNSVYSEFLEGILVHLERLFILLVAKLTSEC